MKIQEVAEDAQIIALAPLLADLGYGVEDGAAYARAVQRDRTEFGTRYFMAQEDGRPVGMLALAFQTNPCLGPGCYMKSLAVARTHRGGPVFRLLWSEALALIDAAGCQWAAYGRRASKRPLPRFAGRYGFRPYRHSWAWGRAALRPANVEDGEAIRSAPLETPEALEPFRPLVEACYRDVAPGRPWMGHVAASLAGGYVLFGAWVEGKPAAVAGGRLNFEGAWEGLLDLADAEESPEGRATFAALIGRVHAHFQSQAPGGVYMRLRPDAAAAREAIETLGGKLGARIFIRRPPGTL
jgi:hypothetical protein